jgi:prephenate dehydrogenase
MGGSMALALRGKVASILGIDPDRRTLDLALQIGAVDEASEHAASLLPGADVVILAAPVRAILSLLNELPGLHPGSAIVMDIGSTKARIIQAMQALPERFDPVGGHPMCGKERSSLANAEAALFQGATFAFIPLARTSLRARSLAGQLAEAIGARPLWLEADTHDRWVAATSHLPYLVANALAAATPAEVAPLIGPGFRSTARLAPSALDVMIDTLESNRPNVLESLRRFQDRLKIIEEKLSRNDESELRHLLFQGAQNYEELIG